MAAKSPPGVTRKKTEKAKSSGKDYTVKINIPKDTGEKFTADTIAGYLDEYHASGLLARDLEKLSPRDRVNFARDLINYIAPKKQAITAEISAQITTPLEKRLADLAASSKSTPPDAPI